MCGKKRFDAACVLKSDLEADDRVEVYDFRRLVIWLLLKPKYVSMIIISFLETVGTVLSGLFLCLFKTSLTLMCFAASEFVPPPH